MAICLTPQISNAQLLQLSQNQSFLNKPQVSVSVSSAYTNFGYGNDVFSTTVMPSFSQKISEKFSVTAGIGYTTLFASNEGSMFNSSPDSYGHIFVSGSYQLTEKITIHGTGYGTFLLNNTTPVVEGNSYTNDFSNKGFIMDMEYKVTDKFRINVGFEYREQNQSMYPGNNMFMNNGAFGGSGFGNNTFYTGHGF